MAIYVRDTIRLSHPASAQEVDLRTLAETLGHQVVRAFHDVAPSRLGSREPRKASAALLMAVSSRRIDTVMVWSLPVVAGAPVRAGEFLARLQDAGAGLIVHDVDPQQAIAAGQALLAAGPHLADLGRAERRRRTLDGQARAVLAGRHIGRPRVSPEKIVRVRAALAAGAGIRAAARIGGVSPASALRISRTPMNSLG